MKNASGFDRFLDGIELDDSSRAELRNISATLSAPISKEEALNIVWERSNNLDSCLEPGLWLERAEEEALTILMNGR